MPNYSIRDVESEFLEYLNKLGIPPEDSGGLMLDGRKHRYRIVGDSARTENGEYRIFLDEWPAGYAKSYSAKHNVEYATWSMSSGGMEYTEEEKRAWREKREAEVKARSEEEQKRRDYAVKNAALMWNNATVNGVAGHNYIKNKGIVNTAGIKLLGGELIIPLFDKTGQIYNVQRINSKGEKRFLSGGRKYGCFYRLPCDGKYTFICEGAATALTVREATGCACIIAFDAGNLLPVLDSINDVVNLVFAADNDRKTVGNPGLYRAIEAAYDLCLPVVTPPFDSPKQGSDWNDYAALFGIEKTADEIFRQIDVFLSDHTFRRKFYFPDINDKSKPIGSFENLNYLLRYYGYSIRYNEISRNVEIDIPGVFYSLDNRKNASVADIYSQMTKSGLKIEEKAFNAYILKIADTNRYNPAADFIKSVPWDGVDRIRALAETLILGEGCDLSWSATLLRRWFLSGVAAACSRGLEKGLPFWTRGVLVLLGAQNIGKTSWFRRLSPNTLFSEGVSLSLDNKDDVKRAISSWITEFGELDGTFKRTDMARLKAFISNQYDEIRLPYAKSSERLCRRTIFCASVNRPDILQDDTGSSRWWVINLTGCDFTHNIDINQVWAQVYNLYQSGEQWWLTQDEENELKERNSIFEPSNKFEDLILSKFDFKDYDYEYIYNDKLTAMEVLYKCGVFNPPNGECQAASAVLRKLTGHAPERIGKDRKRVFRMPLLTITP